MGPHRPAGVPPAAGHPPLLRPLPLGGGPRAAPRRHRHRQDLRHRPRDAIRRRRRPPPPAPRWRGGGGGPGAVCRGRHGHKGMGEGNEAVPADGEEGQGSRAGRRGAARRPLVPGGERRRHRPRRRRLRPQHGEAHPRPPRRSRPPVAALHPGKCARPAISIPLVYHSNSITRCSTKCAGGDRLRRGARDGEGEAGSAGDPPARGRLRGRQGPAAQRRPPASLHCRPGHPRAHAGGGLRQELPSNPPIGAIGSSSVSLIAPAPWLISLVSPSPGSDPLNPIPSASSIDSSILHRLSHGDRSTARGARLTRKARAT